MYYQGFGFILIFLVSLVPIGFTTTYLIAVFNHHVEPGFPYISDTGALPPESCIFAQILATGSFLTFLLVYVRYHHVKLCILNNDTTNLNQQTWSVRINKAGFIFGVMSCIGLTLVGSFQTFNEIQKETNVSYVHFIGAAMAFGGLFVYVGLQTYISKRFSNILFSSQMILYFRIFLLSWCFIFIVLFAVFSQIARKKFNGKDAIKWLPTDGGFTEHVISTSSEWALAILLIITLITFFSDFKRIKMSYPTINDPIIPENQVNDQNNNDNNNDNDQAPLIQNYGTI